MSALHENIHLESARQQVRELAGRYRELTPNENKRYNEENTKKDFILPLFKALGWNVDDSSEVAAEEKASSGRVDYAFKLGGISQLYVEAKPLRADLFNPDFARQAITYAFNKGVTWAVLTNFDEILVFYALAETNNLNRAQYLHLTSKGYVTDFEKLWLLSKESVAMGRLDDEAQKLGIIPTRRPLTVEKRLFRQLQGWREELFTQLLLYDQPFNPPGQDLNSSLRNVDEVIQRLLNRLLFIRTCEDRNIEERRLLALVNQWRSSGRKGELLVGIRDLFKLYEGYYDSDIFARHMVDDAFLETPTLEKMILGLYEVPGGLASYDFSAIDADVLGQVYEQYLGHVAVAARQRANELQHRLDLGLTTTVIELEAKRQKRKESGIYYTTKWVVDYIIQQTLGRLLKCRPRDEVSRLKILDPACGSGSFLIRAYDEFLKCHAEMDGKDVADLDQDQRLSVLTTNIFGVDLDQQAVEIARLNLLLRALARQGKLPVLSDNIKRGNSLVAGDESELEPYFGDAWEAEQPFNWEDEFPEIMGQGGFDVVLGNPPYVGFQGFKEKSFLRDRFATARGRFDLYIPFIEMGLRLLKPGGLLGFICPTNFMKRSHGEALRKYCRSRASIIEITDFKDRRVFEGALNYTGIFILRKGPPAANHRLAYKPGSISVSPQEFDQASLDDDVWVFRSQEATRVISAMDSKPVETLGDISFGISEGVVTGRNEVFVLPEGQAQTLSLEEEITRPVLRGKDIRRYFTARPDSVLIYPYTRQSGRSIVIPEMELQERQPHIWKYLTSIRSRLEGRSYFNASGKAWYELWNERNFEVQASDKIVVSELAEGNRFAFCPASVFYMDTACGITLRPGYDALYVLGILNSRLMDFYYKNTTVPKANNFFIYKTMFLRRMPIRRINRTVAKEAATHDEVVSRVSRLLRLQESLDPIRQVTSTERDQLQHQIDQASAQIDELVYDLYGLTEEQRVVVRHGL